MAFHKNLTEDDIHTPFWRTYADQTARLADTAFVAGDDGKMAWQQSDNTFWLLSDYTGPTWVEFGATGATGPAGADGAGVPDPPTLAVGADGDVVTTSLLYPVQVQVTFDVATTVLASADFATFELCERPNSNLLIVGCELELDGTKTNSFSINFAVGSEAMASSSLGATNTDILTASGSLYNGTTGAFPTYHANGVDDGTNGPTRLIPADANEHFHLNVQHVVNSNSDITLTGTLTIQYIDMGGPAA